MSQRMLNDKEAVALNLIYLAKGLQHKFNDNTNNFLLKCADLAFENDSLSLNALLLKAEVTENRLFQIMKKDKITTASQARVNPKTQKLLASYEKQLDNLYKLGYREIPKDIEHILLSANHGNQDGYITTDKTPNPFASIGQKQRYATLSRGLFDETHTDVDTIQYFHTSLNTKKKKIIEFLPIDTTNNYKVDPVVFAMSVDPLTKMYPWQTPYAYIRDNPIFFIDVEGEGDPLAVMQVRANRASNLQGIVRTPLPNHPNAGVPNSQVHQGFDLVAAPGTAVLAVKEATVYQIINDENAVKGYGKTIILKITNDKGEVSYAIYAHLDKINISATDKNGNATKVDEGVQIGTTGTSGRKDKSEPHLHFEYANSPELHTGLGGKLNPNDVLDTKFYSQDKNADQTKTGVTKVDKKGIATKMNYTPQPK